MTETWQTTEVGRERTVNDMTQMLNYFREKQAKNPGFYHTKTEPRILLSEKLSSTGDISSPPINIQCEVAGYMHPHHSSTGQDKT